MKDNAIGREVDGYRIEGVLGRGGMGVVYKGIDVALSRPVALKRINPGQSHREAFLHRFRSEARALARINSPNIVSIYALRETDIGLLIVMEYVDGGTVADRMGDGPMSVPDALPYLRQMLSAFEDAHDAEVIHRDIKPQNLLCTTNEVIKVTDFGIAKMRQQDSGETVTQGGQGGTLKYMSPEQISDVKLVDNRSDLYSIGMTAYKMMVGHLPFESTDTDFDIMRKVVEGEIPAPRDANPELPEPIARWLIKSTQKQPADRYQDAAQMCDALEEAVREVEQGGGGWNAGGAASDGGTILADPMPSEDAPTVLGDDTATRPAMPEMPEADDATIVGDVATDSDDSMSDDSMPSVSDVLDESDDRDGAPPTGTDAPSDLPDETQKDESEEKKSAPWGLIGAAVVVLLLAAGGGYWMLGGDTATLTLEPAPSGARVLVDGEAVGTTPLRGQTLSAGLVTVTVSKPGYAPFDTTFQATAGERYTLGVPDLQPTSTADASTTETSGDNGSDASAATPQPQQEPSSSSQQTSPTSPTSPNTSSEASEQSEPSPSSTPSETAAPEPSGPAPATVAFDIQPSGGVYIDGQRKGASGQVQVPPGTHEISCRHPQHGRLDTTLTVTSGVTESVNCYFEQPVSVTAMNGWGNVWVNGENTGKRSGPEGQFRLGPGEHTIGLPLQRDGSEADGGAYRARAGDITVARRRFDGSQVTIRVRPGFREVKHAISFQVVNN